MYDVYAVYAYFYFYLALSCNFDAIHKRPAIVDLMSRPVFEGTIKSGQRISVDTLKSLILQKAYDRTKSTT